MDLFILSNGVIFEASVRIFYFRDVAENSFGDTAVVSTMIMNILNALSVHLPDLAD